MMCGQAMFLLDVRGALISSVYIRDDQRTETMQHYDWVESIRATGGIANDDKDIEAAITSAVNFIWALLETRNVRVYGFVHSGIPYIASYMVSCAMHEDSNIWQLNKQNDDHREMFRKEADKNTGILEELLSEAAQLAPKTLHFHIASAGVEWGLSMTEFGKRRRAF